ncbi:helix-turn-helix domain-containing protein [Methylomagnum sp.]
MSASPGNLAEDLSAHLSGDRPGFVLSEHVRLAMRTYFARLDGHEATNLYAMVINEVEKPLIETVLEQCGHNQSRAAQVLGLSRSTLRKKMTQYGIE